MSNDVECAIGIKLWISIRALPPMVLLGLKGLVPACAWEYPNFNGRTARLASHQMGYYMFPIQLGGLAIFEIFIAWIMLA